MKCFLRKTALFAIITLLICIGIELFLLTVSNGYSYKRRYVEENGDRIKVLVLGHSYTATGIIPEHLGDSVFNMAISGRTAHYDAVLAQRYVPTLKNLKCVIWPLRYNSQYLSYIYPCASKEGTQKSINFTSTYQCMYEKYMNISYEPLIPYLHWSELLNSRLEYGSRIFKRGFREKHECTPSGFEPMSASSRPSDWQTNQLTLRIDYDHPNATLALNENIGNLKRIASACNKAGVRLVVVAMPCYSTFTEMMTERGKAEMLQCVDSMQSAYPLTEYYSFIDDPRFTEDDFFDASHLHEKGAEKFSLILKDTLKL